jgi:hypothetical protein
MLPTLYSTSDQIQPSSVVWVSSLPSPARIDLLSNESVQASKQGDIAMEAELEVLQSCQI